MKLRLPYMFTITTLPGNSVSWEAGEEAGEEETPRFNLNRVEQLKNMHMFDAVVLVIFIT